jgi:predicted HTH transcriptional regulator
MNRETPQSLRRLIAQGEGTTLDFKKTISSPQKIAKTLCAFANSHGGSLLIGVADSGKVVGTDPEEESYMIESAANFWCRPIVPYELQVHEDRGSQVLEVIVPQSVKKPHAAKNDDDGKWWVYIRVADQSLLASKVVVDVLRRETHGQDALFEFTSKEEALLKYLQEHPRITLKEYCKLINVSLRRARRIIVDLAYSGVIRVHTTEQTEYYTLA